MTVKRAILFLIVFSLAFSQSACAKRVEISETEIIPAEEAQPEPVEAVSTPEPEQPDEEAEYVDSSAEDEPEPGTSIPEELLGYIVPEIDYEHLGSFSVDGMKFRDEEPGWREDTEEEFRARSADEQYRYADLYLRSMQSSEDYLCILYHYMDAVEKGSTAALTRAAYVYYGQRDWDEYNWENWLPGCYYWSNRAIEAGEVGDSQVYLGYCYFALGEEYWDTAEDLLTTALSNGAKLAAYYLSEIEYKRGNYTEASDYTREFIEGFCEKRSDAIYTDWFGRLPEEDIEAYAGIWYNDSRTCIQLFSNGFCDFYCVTESDEQNLSWYAEMYGRELPISSYPHFFSWQVENGYVVVKTTYSVSGFLSRDYWRGLLYFIKDGDQLVFHHAECDCLTDSNDFISVCFKKEDCLEPTSFRKVSPAVDDGYTGVYRYFRDYGSECREVHISCIDGVYQSYLWINNLMGGLDEYAYLAEDGSYMTLTDSGYGVTYRFSHYDNFYHLDLESADNREDSLFDGYAFWPQLTRVASFW